MRLFGPEEIARVGLGFLFLDLIAVRATAHTSFNHRDSHLKNSYTKFISGIIVSITLADLLVLIIGLVVLWAVISVPAWVAGKAVTGGTATFGDAMLATLVGPVVYVVVLFLADFFLGPVAGAWASALAYAFAFVGWVGVYRWSFETGWLQGAAIALLSVLLFVALGLALGLVGLALPAQFFPGP